MAVAELQDFQRTLEKTRDPGKNPMAKLEVLAALGEKAAQDTPMPTGQDVAIPTGQDVAMLNTPMPTGQATPMPTAPARRSTQTIPAPASLNQQLKDIAPVVIGNLFEKSKAQGLKGLAGTPITEGLLKATADEERGTPAQHGGGIMELAAGGEFSGTVPGKGHGMQDNVRMPIAEGPQQVGTLAVSPSEYVVDSYTMAALGNGNPDAGADVMDKVVENVRQRAYGSREQPNEISGLSALRPMIERV
tara:strand:- start:1346 stop:2086 length:741 start_codon:yes stop_codon:yes gene_type:complete